MLEGEGEELGSIEGLDPVEQVVADGGSLGLGTEGTEAVSTSVGVNADLAGFLVTDEPRVTAAVKKSDLDRVVRVGVECLKGFTACVVIV